MSLKSTQHFITHSNKKDSAKQYDHVSEVKIDTSEELSHENPGTLPLSPNPPERKESSVQKS
jgi:hypothetical protein